MSKLQWDLDGTRLYETGVDRGVLYLPTNGSYDQGFAWNGLTAVTESPSGAEPTPMYADNIKYLNLLSREDFMATVEAMTYPPEFAQCDGSAELQPGVSVAQQRRRKFGLSYRTRLGNDDLATDYGYKLHLVYGALAAPSEKAYATINDTPEGIVFSWELSTTEVQVTDKNPTALVTVDSTKVASANLLALQNLLWGTDSTDPRLPLPDEVAGIFSGTLISVTPDAPTYTSGTRTVTIPTKTGVTYRVNGIVRTGSYVIPAGEYAVVKASANAGYVFPSPVQDTWVFGG